MKEVNNPTQTKSAITLTIAAVILVSGVWALWFTPSYGYENRKGEQIHAVEFVIDGGKSSTQDFDLNQVQEITITPYAQIIPDTSQDQSQPQTPVFSMRVYDPEGRLIKSYDNVTGISQAQRIEVEGKSGTFKAVMTNNDPDHSIRANLSVMDVSKVPNHPLDALGQWLTVASLPIFGLAAWLGVSRRRHAQTS